MLEMKQNAMALTFWSSQCLMKTVDLLLMPGTWFERATRYMLWMGIDDLEMSHAGINAHLAETWASGCLDVK